MKTPRKFLSIAVAAFMFALPACESNETFEVWDTDGSGELSQAEFETAFTNAEFIAQYDKNGNDFIESDEFVFASFDYWDTNNDDVLEEAEFDDGVVDFYDVYDYDLYGYYDDWDVDDNDLLEEDEFETAYVETDIFQAADDNSDGKLNMDEISNLVFNAMDEDGDEEVAQNEFQEDVLVRVNG